MIPIAVDLIKMAVQILRQLLQLSFSCQRQGNYSMHHFCVVSEVFSASKNKDNLACPHSKSNSLNFRSPSHRHFPCHLGFKVPIDPLPIAYRYPCSRSIASFITPYTSSSRNLAWHPLRVLSGTASSNLIYPRLFIS